MWACEAFGKSPMAPSPSAGQQTDGSGNDEDKGGGLGDRSNAEIGTHKFANDLACGVNLGCELQLDYIVSVEKEVGNRARPATAGGQAEWTIPVIGVATVDAALCQQCIIKVQSPANHSSDITSHPHGTTNVCD